MLTRPHISVIVPCHNGATELEYCLAALSSASSPAIEYIVVDDGSTDDSATVALSSALAVRLLSMGQRRGSAAARNAGARAATGHILVFIDSDVAVYSNTLDLIAAAFAADPTLGALIGSYDQCPSAVGFYSQYRNLLHSFTHHTAPRQASTFWTGCGAMRRRVFWEQGGFDETPGAVDDIDLGGRAARSGVRIELHPDVQVTHRKRWTLLSTLRTDLLLRGIPWTLVILRDGRMPNALNLNFRNRFSVGLVWFAALLGTLLARIVHQPTPLTSLAVCCLAAVVGLNRNFYHFLYRSGGLRFALKGIAAHLLHFLLCGFAFLIGLAIFAAARALARPIPASVTAPHFAVPRESEVPSYASGD